MLELDAISVSVGDFELSDLKLRVERGEYFVLIGPTGAGKTVLLEIIAGIVPPSAGRILWLGADLTNQPPEARPVATVFQDLGLFPHLTVAGNIEYGPRITGVSQPERRARVHRLAQMLEIGGILERSVAGLSGGEKQRVALARALAVEPQVLLLDEPLTGLDPSIRDRLKEILRRIHDETDTTVIHVTHDHETGLALADRVAVLLNRRLHPPTIPSLLFRCPVERETAGFLGLSNIFDVVSTGGDCFQLHGHEVRAEGLRPGPAVVWIRPEEIRIGTNGRASAPGPSIDGEVRSVTLLGTQAEVLFAAGDLVLTVLVKPGTIESLSIEPGNQLTVVLPAAAIYVFPPGR